MHLIQCEFFVPRMFGYILGNTFVMSVFSTRNLLRSGVVAALCLAGVDAALPLPAQVTGQATVGSASSADKAVVREFNQRLQRYMDLRRKIAPPPKSSSAEDLLLHRDEIRDKIVAGRLSAKRGDVFTPEISAYFRRKIAVLLSGAHGAKTRASLERAEPVLSIPLNVNGKYPSNVPLQSTPPSLLLTLPPLPKELEYRVVNRVLVLRDKEANLIVDFIPDAIAAPQHP